MSLSILLDDADPAIWATLLQTGIFSGITTNPTLLKQAGQPCTLHHLKKMAQIAEELGCKELHLQAWGASSDELANCGLEINKFSTQKMKICVKIPVTKEGSKAAKKLISSKISITLTCCYEVKQVIIASALGANYIAPYLGRICDQGRDGQGDLVAMQNILKGTNSNCKILVASVRDISQINYLASHGLTTFTINRQIAEDLYRSKLTDDASKNFEKDARV